METDNHEIKDQLIIKPNGLIGSLRNKKEDDEFTFFGYNSFNNEEETVINNLYNNIYKFIYF